MPWVHSNLSLEVSLLSWKIVRYGSPHTYCVFIALTVPQRTKANKQAIELLIPRAKALAETLCTPVPEGDIREESRRKILELYYCVLQYQGTFLT